jgi:2-polyprenyl-3-methyl-5-hydroxy-6-metoxy-1,4-benzoquinol methylase
MRLSCWCGNRNYKEIGWKEERRVVECLDCGHWYIDEIPDDYLEMYKGNWYQNGHQVNIGHLPYKDRYWHDYKIAIARLNKIQELREEGSLLDVGCSNGAFVHCARSYGYQAFGLDLMKSTSELKGCRTGYIEEETSEFWDILTLHDVIDPQITIHNLWRIIKKYGLLVMETPDFGCEEFKSSGINWKHVRPSEHIHMISPNRLMGMLEKQGFKIIEKTYPIPGKIGIYAEKA